MKSILLLLLLTIAPLSSAFAYEYYDIVPFRINEESTICYISYDYVKQNEEVTKQAISNWQDNLKKYTNNYDILNMNYNFILNDYENDIRNNLESVDCDIFVDFVENVKEYENKIMVASGLTQTTISNHTVIQISTSSGLSQIELATTVTHELGHALGLGHYITNEPELIEKWNQCIDTPSIMIKHVEIEEITELDLEKIVLIYGTDGFSKFPPGGNIPDWIHEIYGWNNEGLITDENLENAINYLIQNSIL